MSEIYRDKTNVGLQFDVTGATVTSAEFLRNGKVVATTNTGATINVPYSITSSSGPFQVRWTYTIGGDEYERTEDHSVVTPLFNKAALTNWDTDFNDLSDEKVVYLERLVRQIIETYTGQKFEKNLGPVTMTVASNGSLVSPERILRLRNKKLFVGADAYTVESYTSIGFNIKIPAEAEAYTEGWHAPSNLKTGSLVSVAGEFGWDSVPEEVKTAALYLAEAFTCDESLWRERYIKSVRAADWRFDYSEAAFASTGSLVADQLLTPYVRMGYGVV